MTEIIVLRLVHVVAAIFWAGSGLFTGLFLIPVLMKAGPAAAPVMAGLQQRHLYTALPVSALLTIVTGARLLWIVSGGMSAGYFVTGTGLTFTVSGGAAVLAFALALLVARPAAVRAGQLTASLTPASTENQRTSITETVARLRRRSGVASTVALILLMVAAGGMAVARYLG